MYSVKAKDRPLWVCHDNVNGLPCFKLGSKRERALFDTRWEAMGVAEKRVFGDDYKKVCYAVKEV